MTFENKFRNFVGRINQLEKVEIIEISRELLSQMNEEQRIMIEGWKGKSSFEIKPLGDTIYVTKYQRKDKYSNPKEQNFEIKTEDLTRLKIQILNWFKYLRNIKEKDGQSYLKSTEIAEGFYKRSWKEIFNDRSTHNLYTICLNVLDKQGVITYRGGHVYLR
jgi:hypothetical protein